VRKLRIVLLLALGLLVPGLSFADDGVTPGQFTANNAWMMLCAGLVFIMHLGFATLESGLTRAKNTTNILSRTRSSYRSACSRTR
jgi:Amt family ammonium transporter